MADTRTFTGSRREDYYRGTEQADLIVGLRGDDDLGGGAGDDRIFGGDGNDVLEGGAGSDSLDGGLGIDAASYAGATGEVHVDLALGEAREFAGQTFTTDTLDSIEVVIGSRFDDSISGSAGADDLRGGAGLDVLRGGEGDDVLRGDEGDDLLDGGAGFDYADYFYTDGVAIDLTAPNSTAAGFGNDDLRDIEGVIGSRSADTMLGNAVANHFIGYSGHDLLQGAGGDDRLDGGNGHDRLVGGAGSDVLSGGAGRDLFVFGTADLGTTLAAADRISDFSSVERDVIDLRTIDADVSTARNDAFTFIGNAAFSGVAGELRFAARDGFTVVEGDVNGDGIADGVIVLDGAVTLLATDFGL